MNAGDDHAQDQNRTGEINILEADAIIQSWADRFTLALKLRFRARYGVF